jgi:hypothetical protein
LSCRHDWGRSWHLSLEKAATLPQYQITRGKAKNDVIFERFHRIPHSRLRMHEGTGIGLVFVYELMRLQDGLLCEWLIVW